jgi:lipopolysaccharide/colanic/teichoic acid biosynthesis glycosyltransferase
MKRLLDVLLSLTGLLITGPFLLFVMLRVWAYDRGDPLYRPLRSGRDGARFRMVKLRTMVVNADSSGVSSTAANDGRITPVGHFIRRHKLDELMQLWNVLVGDMSLVGPRPNLPQETTRYTAEEMKLLTVRPGITDFSSIVFADEGDILRNKPDPDLAYDQLIRPWKSRLGVFYVENQSMAIDLRLILLTIQGLVNRKSALLGVQAMLRKLNADGSLIKVAGRENSLVPAPPLGMKEVITSRG